MQAQAYQIDIFRLIVLDQQDLSLSTRNLKTINMMTDELFMREAMLMAENALQKNEVPIGAIIVKDGQIIARGWNQVESLKNATAHAEMQALHIAQEILGDWRLEGCTLYVTKEPCPMCAGAIVHCRPDRVVFGVRDPKGGAAGGWINLLQSNPPLNHACDIESGILESECLAQIQTFFRKARQVSKERKRLAKQAEEEGKQSEKA